MTVEWSRPPKRDPMCAYDYVLQPHIDGEEQGRTARRAEGGDGVGGWHTGAGDKNQVSVRSYRPGDESYRPGDDGVRRTVGRRGVKGRQENGALVQFQAIPFAMESS